jgi:ferredoxin-NADP reductase
MHNFPRPQIIKASVTLKEFLNPRVLKLNFTYTNTDEIVFLPGQFVSIKVAESKYRSYSICSSPIDTKNLSIVAAVTHDGIGANYLRSLDLRDQVEMIGPSGRFVLPQQLENDLFFVATGTGIAPFMPMLEQLNLMSSNFTIKLLFGVRDENELFFMEELKALATRFPNFECFVCFSQNIPDKFEGNEKVLAKKGRVTEYIDYQTEGSQYFLCGNRFMIEEVMNKLTSNGVDSTRVYHEKF